MTALATFAAVVTIALAVCAMVAAFHQVEKAEDRAANAEAMLQAEYAEHEITREALHYALRDRLPVDELGTGTPVHDGLTLARFRQQIDGGAR